MRNVVVTAGLPADLAALLGEGFHVAGPAPEEIPRTREQVAPLLRDAFALVPIPSFSVDRELLEQAPSLRLVACYSVGFDNVDLAACERRGIVVTNTPDVLTDATADLTLALLLAVARRVVWGDQRVRRGEWHGFQPDFGLGMDLAGAALGIIGMGRIGQAVARRAAAFGMQIVYASPHPKAEVEERLGARRLPLDALLEAADVVSLHCALTEETRGLLGAERIARMRPGAILLNTARGAMVDENALAEALARGRLGGAGLDVFASEPAVSPALLAAPNTVLLPHLGSAGRRTRRQMVLLCAQAILDVSLGRVPRNALGSRPPAAALPGTAAAPAAAPSPPGASTPADDVLRAAELERRFRELELERDLARLKERMDRERGPGGNGGPVG